MNAKHSPAPWTAQARGTTEATITAHDGGLVADLHSPWLSPADASLIAAAPDLLRALMAIVENADKGFSVTTWTGLDGIADAGTVANVDAARAAIARATMRGTPEGRDAASAASAGGGVK